MTETRFNRTQKAMALVPLALLSTAWTANMVGVGGGVAVAEVAEEHRLPDGTTVPTDAIEDPASFTSPGSIGLGVPEGSGNRIVKASSTNGIPSAALSAYQRAATVINSADKGCNVPWQLIAAIGRVESDHGRYGGNTLSKEGVAKPGIYGIALDGSNNTQAIKDTDAGQFDNDVKFDRAVGPMQFIPATWSVVGVDADGDAKRNPQDIDDSALAAGVYLCSGNDDLSTEAGQRAAVHRYNHSKSYVDLVLDIMNAYLDGNFTSVPNNTTSAATFTPDYDYTPPKNTGATPGPGADTGTQGDADVATDTPEAGSDQGGNDSTPGGNGGSNDGGDSGGNEGGSTPSDDPTKDPVNNAKKDIKKLGDDAKDSLQNPEKILPKTLTRTQATLKCLASGIGKLEVLALDRCVRRLLGL